MTVVAIDGPAGSGKSTIAARLAERLGVPHVDTGAYYRAATLAVLRSGTDITDPAAVVATVKGARIERRDGRTVLDGEDVEDTIRGPEVTATVSKVSGIPGVRALLVEQQRGEVGVAGAVVEGRDAGTVVVPGASLKVWLTASTHERAARRAAQRGEAGPGAVSAELDELSRRDASDHAQMARAADSVELDTTGLTIEATIVRLAEMAAAAGE